MAGWGYEGELAQRGTGQRPSPRAGDPFVHEALLYAGQHDFVERTTEFISDGLTAGEPVLVVVSAQKIGWLHDALGADAEAVQFADMAEVGTNPARIIPTWRRFVNAHARDGRRLRGIGEPIWAERSAAELAEAQRHETLLNLAFAGMPAWWLLCLYDVEALDPAVVAGARRTHPFVQNGRFHRDSRDYRPPPQGHAVFAGALSEPPAESLELPFGPLDGVRRLVSGEASAAGLARRRIADLVLAVNEVATNSLEHGGGRGVLRLWRDGDAVVCEIRDGGCIDQPLVGREIPSLYTDRGRGLWLANQLCDLVEIRSSRSGTAVRLHVSRR